MSAYRCCGALLRVLACVLTLAAITSSTSADQITTDARSIWRDYSTDGVPTSGVWNPRKGELRAWGALVGSSIVALQASQAAGPLAFDTKANLDASLAYAANTMAFIFADGTSSNNGVYSKVGASGSGSWSKVSTLVYGPQPTFTLGTVTRSACNTDPTASVSGTALAPTLNFSLPDCEIDITVGTVSTVSCGTPPSVTRGGADWAPVFNFVIPDCGAVVGGLSYRGAWNASSNSPTITSGACTAGYFYVVGTAGTTTINSISTWYPGDFIMCSGSNWQRVPASTPSAGGRVYLSNYSIGSSTGGFAEAFAACPTYGCVVVVDQDTTLSGAISPVVNMSTKSLVIEGGGYRLTCAASTGETCLKLQFSGSGDHWPVLTIRNMRMAYSGSSTGVIGLHVYNWSGYTIEGSAFTDFSTTDSTAVKIEDAFDGHLSANTFQRNFNALHLKTANQIEIGSTWFQLNPIDYGSGSAGGVPLLVENTSNVRIHDGLMQSNNTVCGVKFWANGQNVVQSHLENMHFENQGDGSSSARQVCFVATSGNGFFGVAVRDNWFNAGTSASISGKIFGLSGGGGAYQIVQEKNKYAGVSESNIWDGSINAWDVTCINELQSPATSPCGGVKLNDNNIVGGLSFGIPTSARRFGVYAGAPGNYDGALNFYDFTASSRVGYVNQYGWSFLTTIYGYSTVWAGGFVAWGDAPTLGGSCSAGTYVGGSTAGRFTLSGACSDGTISLTGLPNSNNAWACQATNLTAAARAFSQTSYGNTSAWFTGTGNSGDVISYLCVGY